MKMIRSGKTMDWCLVILMNFMWATQVPVIRFIGDALGPIAIAYIPLIISTLMFLPVLLIENSRRKVKMKWRWGDIKYFILPGLLGVFVMQLAFTWGSQRTLAANAGIIMLSIPVIVAIFASFLLQEKLNAVRIIGFILAIGGVLLTSLSDISGANFKKGDFLTGNLVFLFACFCCGFYNTYCKRLVDRKYTELEILVYGSIIASLASIPLLLWVEPFHYSNFIQSGRKALWGILELSIVVYGLSMLVFFYVLRRMDVTQAVMGNYLLPFFVGLLGVVLLNERITGIMIAGGVMILVSTLMVSVYESRIISFFGRNVKKGLAKTTN